VKYPTAKAVGFYAVPLAERTRKGLRGTLPAPCVRCNLGRWLVGSAYVNDWHTERFGSLVLLPKGAYLGTGKHYWVVSVHRVPALGTSLAVSRYPREHSYYSTLTPTCQHGRL